MKRLTRFTLALLACSTLAASAAFADDLTGLRKEFKASVDDAGGKLMELAEATPQAKYAWRPSKDARSAAEVYLHVISANFGIPTFIGIAPAANSPVTQENFATFEKSTTDKAKIVAMLKDSFAYADQAIASVADSDLETQVTFFGMTMSKRAALLVIVNHAHEHLGQSIAYARSNKIVPPWTARELAAAAAKKAAGAKSGGSH